MNLLDIIELEEAKADPENCKHLHEEKTLTVWPGETCKRMTWTCKGCGKVRGRC